ncbi:hypothetical protein RJG79_07215 [Mycoplasmatota bacterium WC44]
MSDKREPNSVVKASKQQLPKVNSIESDLVIQNKDRSKVYNEKEEFASELKFENNAIFGSKFVGTDNNNNSNISDKEKKESDKNNS